MKRIMSIVGIGLILVLVLAGGVVGYVSVALPDVETPETLSIEYTPERIERGKYLATAVSLCIDCHSTRDWTQFAAPVLPGTFGKGGERFDQSMGFPGVFYSKNITPAALAAYTDAELYRAITAGVDKDGHALFPMMPYLYYGKMDEEDIYSIIAYVRSMEPIENTVPESEPDFPMNIILNTLPSPPAHTRKPDPSDVVAYGGYLVNAAGCAECHTPAESGQIVEELMFSGGREFQFPGGAIVRGSNITPDDDTGIGKWSKENFVERFKLYADTAFVPPTVNPGDFNTVMPWLMYCHMTEQDLSAIYEYLRTVEPIRNEVVKFSPAAGQ